MIPTPWATMKTLPPGSGSGPDLREYLERGPGYQIDADSLARLAAGPFPVVEERRFDVEGIQELIDFNNYGHAAYFCAPAEDDEDWERAIRLVREAYGIVAGLCRRRDEREGR